MLLTDNIRLSHLFGKIATYVTKSRQKPKKKKEKRKKPAKIVFGFSPTLNVISLLDLSLTSCEQDRIDEDCLFWMAAWGLFTFSGLFAE